LLLEPDTTSAVLSQSAAGCFKELSVVKLQTRVLVSDLEAERV